MTLSKKDKLDHYRAYCALSERDLLAIKKRFENAGGYPETRREALSRVKIIESILKKR